MRLMVLFQSLLLSVIYLWSQANSERIVSFMFGVQFKVGCTCGFESPVKQTGKDNKKKNENMKKMSKKNKKDFKYHGHPCYA
jgi:hypothetical protein